MFCPEIKPSLPLPPALLSPRSHHRQPQPPPSMLTPLQAYKQLCQLDQSLPQTVSIDCKPVRTHQDDASEGKPEAVQELVDSRNSPPTSENMSFGSREASPRTPPVAEPRTPPPAEPLSLPGAEPITLPLAEPCESKCWGSLFDHHCQGAGCNGEKLIDKFCSVCRTTGLLVAAKRVRALLPEHYKRFANSRKEGFWTEGSGATPRFRVVNQTKECTGAWLVLFENEPVGVPVDWVPMPPDWHESTAYIRLWLSKGTMVPRQPRPKLKRKSSSFSSDAGPFPPPVLAAAPSTPVLARRVQPQPKPKPKPKPNLPDELLLGDASAQEAEADLEADLEADFVRHYRAMHDAMRALIEARLARAELPLVDEQREALAEQLRLSSASKLVFDWDRDQDGTQRREALSDREREDVGAESES